MSIRLDTLKQVRDIVKDKYGTTDFYYQVIHEINMLIQAEANEESQYETTPEGLAISTPTAKDIEWAYKKVVEDIDKRLSVVEQGYLSLLDKFAFILKSAQKTTVGEYVAKQGGKQ